MQSSERFDSNLFFDGITLSEVLVGKSTPRARHWVTRHFLTRMVFSKNNLFAKDISRALVLDVDSSL